MRAPTAFLARIIHGRVRGANRCQVGGLRTGSIAGNRFPLASDRFAQRTTRVGLPCSTHPTVNNPGQILLFTRRTLRYSRVALMKSLWSLTHRPALTTKIFLPCRIRRLAVRLPSNATARSGLPGRRLAKRVLRHRRTSALRHRTENASVFVGEDYRRQARSHRRQAGRG